MLKVRGDEINARKRENYKRKREQVIESYGGKCSCPGCEESHVEFLHIDHVNNDGNKARKSNIHSNGKGFLNWIIKNDYPPIFQLLCANCNLAKAFYGSCPHEREYLYHLETGL
jgi:hypothetical protein